MLEKKSKLESCVIYVRVSTQEQKEDGHSLQGQEKACRAYVEANGGSIHAVYSDVVSGKAQKRAKLDHAIATAVREKATLVFWDIDRMGRHEATCHKIKDLLGFQNLLFVTTPYMQELEFSLRVGMAAEELRKLSARTKMGMAVAREKGKTIGRSRGCTISSEAIKKSIETRKEQTMQRSQAVKNIIVVERGKGLSYEKIAKKLTEYSFTTEKGSAWTGAQVRRVFLQQKIK